MVETDQAHLPSPTESAEVLRAAADRVENVGWTQLTAARDERGEPVDSDAPLAVCWCALGAIGRETRSRGLRGVWDIFEAAGGDDFIIDFNDTEGRTAHEVAAYLRKRADELEAEIS